MIKPTDPRVRVIVERILKKFADEGRLIEGGWASFVEYLDPNITAAQLHLLKTAYYASAEHLFSSIMAIMDDDREPTENDLNKMGLIEKEIEGSMQLLYEFVNKRTR